MLTKLKNTQIHPVAEFLQQADAGNAVAVFVQGRAKNADAHTGGGHCHDAAAHTALGGDAHTDGEIARAVVHTAGQQNGVDILSELGGEDTLIRAGSAAAIGQNGAHAGQILAGDLNGTGPEIAVQHIFTSQSIRP